MREKVSLLSINDLSQADIIRICSIASALRDEFDQTKKHWPYLQGKSLSIICDNPPLSHLLSFEVGMFQLGGHADHINFKDLVEDTGYDPRKMAEALFHIDMVVAINLRHELLEALASHMRIPLLNGISDKENPILDLEQSFARITGNKEDNQRYICKATLLHYLLQ